MYTCWGLLCLLSPLNSVFAASLSLNGAPTQSNGSLLLPQSMNGSVFSNTDSPDANTSTAGITLSNLTAQIPPFWPPAPFKLVVPFTKGGYVRFIKIPHDGNFTRTEARDLDTILGNQITEWEGRSRRAEQIVDSAVLTQGNTQVIIASRQYASKMSVELAMQTFITLQADVRELGIVDGMEIVVGQKGSDRALVTIRLDHLQADSGPAA